MSKKNNYLRKYDKLRKDYNEISKLYDKLRFGNPGGKYVDDVEKNIVLSYVVGNSILELGGGTGRYGITLRKKGYTYTEIDISIKMLKVAKSKSKKKNIHMNLIQANTELLPFSTNCVSSIICIHSIQYFLDPLKALKEAYKVLKPKGRIIITSETDYFYRRIPILREWIQRKERQRYFSAKSVELLLKKAGFKIVFERSLFSLGSIAFYRKLPLCSFKLISKFDNKIKKGSILFMVGEK